MSSNNHNINSIPTNFRDYNLYNDEKTNDNTASLKQGDRFLHYQNKIKNQTVGSDKGRLFSKNKEGFSTHLKKDTNITLHKTKFNSDEDSTLRDLKLEYASTLEVYKKLNTQLQKESNQFFGRVDPTKNKFLGKNIRFRGGELCYVTMQGVARLYTDSNVFHNTAGKNGCPSKASTIPVNIPWKSKYAAPGATIPTRPPLISGPPMIYGQACGNEGSNVYVNQSISTKPKYKGTFIDDDSSGITYIGEQPPVTITVQNPNFSYPVLKNNSFKRYNSSSSVPGWSFKAIIVNNSSAWGFPRPYPAGNKQCASLQNTLHMSQTFSNLSAGTYTLSFYVCGRPGRNGSNPVNLNLNNITFYTIESPETNWVQMSINFNVSQPGANTISFAGQNRSGDKSTAFTQISLVFGSDANKTPAYTYDMCETQATTQGYQYFGLTGASEDKGYCLGTSDYVAASGTGTSYKTASTTALWSSGTNGKGSYAKLTSMGTLQVYDSNNRSVYSTPAPTGPGTSSFWGCYQDAASTGAGRSIPDFIGDGNTTLDDCRASANQSTNSIYAVQYAINNNGNNGQCFINSSNPTDFLSSLSAGRATNCTKDSSGRVIGQGWSNAVYGTQPGFGCYLMLQNDGNMCIYRGQSPSDKQSGIWCSKTKNKSLISNPNWTPTDGKYGTYWVYNGFNGTSGSDNGCILYSGESIFSSNGKLHLIMQTDGNLVLYTSTIEPNETTDSKGNKMGGENGYSLYGFDDNPNTEYNGTLGYIDGAGTFHKYTDGSKLLDNSYTKYSSLQQTGYQYSINGEQSANKSLANCKKTCTDDPGCGGITYDKQNETCYYNSSDVSLYATSANEYFDTYIKNKEPANPMYTNQIANISGAKYGNYTMGEDMPNGSDFNLQSATAVTSSQLSQTEDKLNQLAAEITKYNAEFADYNKKILSQSAKNIKGTNANLADYGVTTKQIKFEKKLGSNVDAILDDSNIVVLQENYNYAFLSILAVSVVILSMVLIKK